MHDIEVFVPTFASHLALAFITCSECPRCKRQQGNFVFRHLKFTCILAPIGVSVRPGNSHEGSDFFCKLDVLTEAFASSHWENFDCETVIGHSCVMTKILLPFPTGLLVCFVRLPFVKHLGDNWVKAAMSGDIHPKLFLIASWWNHTIWQLRNLYLNL